MTLHPLDRAISILQRADRFDALAIRACREWLATTEGGLARFTDPADAQGRTRAVNVKGELLSLLDAMEGLGA